MNELIPCAEDKSLVAEVSSRQVSHLLPMASHWKMGPGQAEKSDVSAGAIFQAARLKNKPTGTASLGITD